jgi:DNA helicase-2/ATP-dependent DNA helicase PcrA
MIEVHLNPEQREAVEYDDGHLLILAGAGSGKTRVLTAKIARLLGNGTVSPGNILAMTFTNKAAREMERRVAVAVDPRSMPRMGTFHSTCLWFLRREAGRLGHGENCTVYDGSDQKSLMRKLLRSMSLPGGISPSGALSWISGQKSELTTPAEALEDALTPHQEALARVYEAYQAVLAENNAFDFDDLLTLTLSGLRQNTDIRDCYRSRFLRILVDEYQDTNLVQHEILKTLAGPDTHVTVVGDDDQAIYGWRGARVTNILEFPDDFPGTRMVRLETNYRSTGNILSAASALVSHNTGRHGKTLRSVLENGEPVKVQRVASPPDEAEWTVMTAMSFQTRGTPLNRMAVLYRTNAQSREFEAACRRSGIPYEVVGAQRFFEREEVKDIVSYLRVIVNPRDAESLSRVINRPARGVGKKGQESFLRHASADGVHLLTGLGRACSYPGITSRGGKALEELGDCLNRSVEMVSKGAAAVEIIDHVLAGTGLKQQYDPGDVTEQTRLENIEEFRSFAAQYDIGNPNGGLPGFLAEQSLLTTQDAYSEQGLALMTLHCAKGLEFDVVFIAGLEEGLLPHIRQDRDAPADLEEERRLLYVGMTRARKRLFLTSCLARVQQGRYRAGPSRFLAEISSALPESRNSRDSSPGPSIPCPSGEDGFSKGEIIRHPRYGRGMILSARRRGEEWELSIDFGFDEPKTILSGYAPLIREGNAPGRTGPVW